jgi:hypothetical protein
MADLTKDSIIGDLKEHISSLDNHALFGEDKNVYANIESSCSDYLKFLGYKVAKRPCIKSIIKIEDLVSYFYSLLEFYHNETCSLTSNKAKDLSIISRFVSKRKEDLKCSKESAINDCATIIKTLVSNEKELGLDRPIGIWVFGTDKCKWITDRAITLLNNNYTKYNEDIMYQRALGWSKTKSDDYTGMDLEEIMKRRNLNG